MSYLVRKLKGVFMTLKEFELENHNLEGDELVRLFNLCFEYADYFAVADNQTFFEKQKYIDFDFDLKDYHIMSYTTTNWFCYFNKEFFIDVYRACEKSKEILLKYWSNLFVKDNIYDIPGFPEDICFFKGNNIFLGTLSHENMCSFFTADKEMEDKFKSICDWREYADFNYKDYPVLPI